MPHKLLLVFTVCAILIGACWLSLGVYSDREFGGFHLFIKHRPYSRFFFSSPVGESDREPSTSEERAAEKDFVEFVEDNGGNGRSLTIAN